MTIAENVQLKLALRPSDAAEALGISPRLLWQLTHDGQVPCIRLGRKVLYSVAELEAWLRSELRVGTAKEVDDVL